MSHALPSWNLSHLYASPTCPELNGDFDRARADADAFQRAYKGRVADLSGADFGQAIATYERIQEILGRIGSYAYLLFAQDMSVPESTAFLQNTQEKSSDISQMMLFFPLEINKLDETVLGEKLKDPAAQAYACWVRDLRVQAPYQLSDAVEEVLHEKRVAGASSWIRLYDETMASLRFDVDGVEMNCSQVLHLFSDPKEAVRLGAHRAFEKVLQANSRLFAHITNTLAKDKQIEDKRRGYESPMLSRHLDNLVESEVVESLSAAVRAAYPRLAHRYYALKAKWMGKDQLNYWDRNAPLGAADDQDISWDTAKARVLKAYGDFSPTMATIGARFFEERWIDAALRPGKDSGAFSHPTVPCAHPYILQNYHGKVRDVMTLAHELGHGVHQVLAAPQGLLKSGTPLTLAETASVFGEMLTFQSILRDETDGAKRRLIIARKVEDMLNTVVRQIAFYEFEKKVHTQRAKGELSVEQLNGFWMDVQRESLGPAIRFEDAYGIYWSYIPHFIHSPFYVYAYAFGDCLVNSLYAVYQESPQGFEAKYLDMLKAGGTLRHGELLAPFGLNAADPQFWDKGLSMIEGFIDQLDA